MTWHGVAYNPDPVEELMREERRYGQEPDQEEVERKEAERKRQRNESLRHLMFMEEVYRRLWIQGCVSPAEDQWAAEAEFGRVMKEVEEEWSR